MPIIKKYAETLSSPLSSFGTLVVDTDPNSKYFRITELNDTLTAGKNGFLIEGTPFLKETTEIKIQILDVEGNPIYWEPGNGIPEYYEGTSKVIAVYIYNDTPIGDATITILGEAKTYENETGVVLDVPDEWKGVYNVKWQKTVKVNKLLPNEDRVRFYRRPRVTIEELVKPLFTATIPTVIQTGSIDGSPITPSLGERLDNYTLPTFYRLRLADNTNWTGSIVNQRISIPELNYSPLITQIVTNKEVLTNEPYTIDDKVESFDNKGYTASFQHIEGTDNLKTALTGSFAKITISDLTTFVGDVVSVDIYRKSRSKVGDYEFVQKVILESNELLTDYATNNKNDENYGILSNDVIQNYWISSSNATISPNQNYLYNSAQIDVPSGVGYFYTSESFELNKGAEYTLEFNTRTGIVSNTAYLRAFISGSTTSTFNGVTSIVGVEQEIIKLYGSNQAYLEKTLISENFEAQNITGSKLFFEVKGDDWYVSDISLKASQETSFSPNEITVIQSVPRSLISERFDYRFKFYDINGNYIPVNVEASKLFDGGNIQRIEKKLNLNPTSLYFQFDSGSQPVPPTAIVFNIEKTLLTGSVNFTSSSIDFFGNTLSASQYVGGVFPGTLDLTNPDIPVLTVAKFTGSRDDIDVQLVTFVGECEGVTDTVTITAVLDGFGGVNHIIRPYRGTQIRNSSTASLEIQAVRIDGINDIELYSGSRPERGWNLIQLHVLSGSAPFEKFVNLQYASASGFVQGLTKGSLGTGEINYNAIFNRDSIDKRRTIYLMSSASAASDWAFNTSASVLASQILEDLQDGLDTPVVTYNADTFTINFRNDKEFRPASASATASFYLRGTNENPISASILVYPSMSINRDFVPEYWMYWVSQSKDSTISITAKDERGINIPDRLPLAFVGNPLTQSKVLTATFTYTEPYTLTEISIDKTFTIVPEGKPGDETIIFELVPSNLTLNSNAKGIVSTYTPANTQLKLKQGAQYLSFSSSKQPGTFWLNNVTQSMISSGAVNFSETSSMNVTGISNMTELSASLTYDLLIHPYYTSSRYTQSLVQYFTKAVDGPPPIEIILNPQNPTIAAFETGFPKSYLPASTSIQLKEGGDTLIYTSSQARGTWYFESISGSNIQTASITPVNSGQNRIAGGVSFRNFNPQHVSASAFYNLKVFPYSLLPGHRSGSINLFTTQSFTKNVDPKSARVVKLSASSNVINFDGDDVVVSPLGPITLTAEAINITSSNPYYQFFKYDPDSATYADVGQGITQINYYDIDSGDAVGAGETAVYRVELRDGTAGDEVRGIDEVTIFGVKAGSDAFTANITNENTSIQVSLWETTFSGSGTEIRAFKSGAPLVHTSSYVPSQVVYYEYGQNAGLPIGNLGYYSASIHSKSSYITVNPQNRLLGNPASIGNLNAWSAPAVNTTGTVVYKVDFENGRKSEFYSQSISSQITPPAPYNVILSNENSGIIYRVSGEIELDLTSTQIKAYRGDLELTNVSSFSGGQLDMYGNLGYPNQCRVSILAYSGHIVLGGGLTAGSHVSGTPATTPIIANWLNPETYPVAEIIYQIDCEGRETLIKTQSLSVTYEGNTGPGIVMRGVWSPLIDYIAESANSRRDAVIWPDPETINKETHYWAAITGSGPGNGGPQQPDGTAPYNDTAYWQYLGQEEFFVAAQIAIFQESYVKNTINVGTKDGTGAFANIVIAGGRPDPYIAIGQTGTQGTAGKSGTSLSTPGVIGYNRPGIFLGVYEDGANGTTGRFSIKTTGTSGKGMFWDGDTLTIVGSIRQREPGIPEGSFRGTWTPSTAYYEDDTVTYAGSTWICGIAHTSTNDSNVNTGYPPDAINSWSAYASAGTSGTSGQAGTSGTSGKSGTDGPPGAGVVYRGLYNSSYAYFHTTERRDVVKFGSNYYVVNNLAKSGLTTWGTPGVADWTVFGAQFSSVATDILLAQDATITRALVMGTDLTGSGIIRSATAETFTSGSGYYMDNSGRARFGNPAGNQIKFEGDTFQITGSISATDGRIGNWIIEPQSVGGNLRDSGSKLILNPTVPEIGFYLAGSKKLNISPVNYLTNVGGSNINVSDIPNGNGSPYPDWTAPADVNASNTFVEQQGPYSYASVSGFETATTYTIPAAGEYALSNIYTFSVLQVDNLSGNTVYSTAAPPAYSGTYVGDSHFGYASGQYVGAEVYLEARNTTTNAVTRTLLQAAYSFSATSTDYYTWNGSAWVYSSSTNPGAHYGYTTGGFQPISGKTITFPAAGTYVFRYSIRIVAKAGSSQGVNQMGNLLPEVFYNHTSGINTSAADGGIGYNGNSFTIVVPTNIVEVTTGGIQVANDTKTYVQVPRLGSTVNSSDVIFEAKGAKSRFWCFDSSTGDYTNYAVEAYGKMSCMGIVMSGNDSTSSPGVYGRIELATMPKFGNIVGPIYSTGDIHPSSTNWGTTNPTFATIYDMGGNATGQAYWDELYADNFNNLSDYRLKENIYNSDLGLNFINLLRPVSYNMKSSSKKRKKYGLIAQEVNEALNILGKTSDDFKGLNTGSSYVKTIEKTYNENIWSLASSGSVTGSFGELITNEWVENQQNNASWNLTYVEFISPMIKAIQELSEKVNQLEAKISGSI